tara:strand:+ start:275 stop:592 length:318 start_codon:yes stop_codon:yes gene_type:complete
MKQLLIASLFTLLSTTAIAQDVNPVFPPGPRCLPYEQAMTKLVKEYKETRIFEGMNKNGSALIELFVNEETGTWTIIAKLPNKMACMQEMGKYFNTYEIIPGDDL